jgi:hypothetical protein
MTFDPADADRRLGRDPRELDERRLDLADRRADYSDDLPRITAADPAGAPRPHYFGGRNGMNAPAARPAAAGRAAVGAPVTSSGSAR